MSLPALLQATEGYGRFVVINKMTVNDGYGGYIDTYVPGATFDGVLTLDDSINAQIAEKQGVTGVYKLTFDKALRLPWHTIFRREDDPSATYRVTSKDEASTPSTSSLDMRIVSAEGYEVPLNG